MVRGSADVRDVVRHAAFQGEEQASGAKGNLQRKSQGAELLPTRSRGAHQGFIGERSVDAPRSRRRRHGGYQKSQIF